MVAGLRPHLHVEGCLPDLTSSGWLLLTNHYSRPGFGAWWIPLAVSSLAPREVHWVMTSTLTYPDVWRRSAFTPLSEWALGRLAACYGFTSMPPMPPRPQDVERRAAAVRQVLNYVQRTPLPLIGLAPEGWDPPDRVLHRLWPGGGRFLLHLARRGLRFLPIGVYEQAGELCLALGEPFVPSIPDRRTADQQDAEVESSVMRHLAECLPTNLRGVFA
jgi:hypothetical protein